MRRIRSILDSFWFIPSSLCVISVLLAHILVLIDYFWLYSNSYLPGFLHLGSVGARNILIVIGGSVLGVAATSFSITTSVLVTASTSYGPRLVRNFMRDRRNQFVLGMFGATFLYCLMALRYVRGNDGDAETFIPGLTVDVAIILAVINVLLLVHFIHHIADSVQISSLVARVRREFLATIDRLFDTEAAAQPPRSAELPGEPGVTIKAPREAFVVDILYDDIASLATTHDAVIELLVQPGDRVIEGVAYATVWNSKKDLSSNIQSLIKLDTVRYPDDDIRYSAQQLTDIALRALSPGTNDPYTAQSALLGLGSGFVELCQRPNPKELFFDETKSIRLFAPRTKNHELLNDILDTLRQVTLPSLPAAKSYIRLIEEVLNNTPSKQCFDVAKNKLYEYREAHSRLKSISTADIAAIDTTIQTVIEKHQLEPAMYPLATS